MTTKQEKIFDGLSSIGNVLASLYSDGIKILESDLSTKSYLLAHILREIDSGLRNIFEHKPLKKQFESEITNEQLSTLFQEFSEDYKTYEFLKGVSLNDFKDSGYVSSIMASFGLKINDPLTKKYIKVAKWFHKYAHRNEAYDNPRDPSDMIRIWSEYEEVLLKLIGNYFSLANRIDTLLEIQDPNPDIINTLPNLLRLESRKVYFFKNLKSKSWLKPLYEKGFFSGTLNPEPVEDVENHGRYFIPYWPVLEYLNHVGEVNLKTPREKVYNVLCSIIIDIISFRKSDGTRIENYHTEYIIFKLISSLPAKYLTQDHFDFILSTFQGKFKTNLISYHYDIFLERLFASENTDNLLKGFNILLTYKLNEPFQYPRIQSIFDDNILFKILSKFKDLFMKGIEIKILELSIEKIESIIQIDTSCFGKISIDTIKNNEQMFLSIQYEYQIVYLIRDCMEKLPNESMTSILNNFLHHNHSIFNRLAIYIMNVRYSEFGSLFWELNDNPLKLKDAKLEIFDLIREKSVNFSIAQVDKVADWINSHDFNIPENYEGRTILTAFRKKEWLLALSENDSPQLNKLKDYLSEFNFPEIVNPGFDSGIIDYTGEISPLSDDEIIQMDLIQLIDYFDSFSEDVNGNFNSPSKDGLSEKLLLSIRQTPHRYTSNSEYVLNASTQFKYIWIRGLNESWEIDKRTFDYEYVLIIINNIIKDRLFWLTDESDMYSTLLASYIISFLEDGLKNDAHAFESKNLPIIKSAILLLITKINIKRSDHTSLSFEEYTNLNGKILTTILQYSLRRGRVEKNETNQWDNDIIEVIEEKINSEDILVYYILGHFLHNLHYLDEIWLMTNFYRIFPLENTALLSASLSGYLYNNQLPNRKIFELFLQKGHYYFILDNQIKLYENAANYILIEHIFLAYLNEFQDFTINHKLLTAAINQKNEKSYTELTKILNLQNRLPHSKIKHRIKPLWGKIFDESIELRDVLADKFILSNCTNWISAIDAIDEDVHKWLLASLPFLTQIDKSYIFENLSKHIKNSPDMIGNILYELLKIDSVYYPPSEVIIDMTKILYEEGFVEVANEICLMPANRNLNQYRELFERYNF